MAGEYRIEGSTSTNVSEVSSNNQANVNPPTTVNQAGYSAIAAMINDGSSGGVSLVRRVEASSRNRVRFGQESPVFFENFIGAALNTTLWKSANTNDTIVCLNGFVTLNPTGLVAAGNYAMINTYRYFPVYEDLQTRLEYTFQITSQPLFNIFEMGFGIAATTAVPTDGVFIRLNTLGQVYAVINNNGNEYPTLISGLTITPNTNYEVIIHLDVNNAYFYINGILQAVLSAPTTGGAGTTAVNELPIFFRNNQKVLMPIPPPTANGPALRITQVSVTLTDNAGNRAYRDGLCGFSANAIQGQTGQTLGTTANYANSAAPASATLSNTAAGYTTLGGQWQFAAVASSETDEALIGFTVPAGTSIAPGKTLYITGIHIEAVNTGATSATTATIIQWGIATGSSAVSLATADSTVNKSPRRLTLGLMSIPIGALAGTTFTGSPMDIQFDSPLVANAGEFVHVIMKQFLGTATASEIYRGTITINGYFE